MLRAAVKFAPGTAGGAEGDVTFTTGAGSAVPVSVPLIGNGTQTGLFATSPAIDFQIVDKDGELITNVPVGISDPQVTDIVNNGDKAVTVKSVTPPTGTYRAIGLPKVGTVIRPGEAIPVGLVFTPQHNVTTNGSFTITPEPGDQRHGQPDRHRPATVHQVHGLPRRGAFRFGAGGAHRHEARQDRQRG